MKNTKFDFTGLDEEIAASLGLLDNDYTKGNEVEAKIENFNQAMRMEKENRYKLLLLSEKLSQDCSEIIK